MYYQSGKLFFFLFSGVFLSLGPSLKPHLPLQCVKNTLFPACLFS